MSIIRLSSLERGKCVEKWTPEPLTGFSASSESAKKDQKWLSRKPKAALV
jgi:hypothetical protein